MREATCLALAIALALASPAGAQGYRDAFKVPDDPQFGRNAPPGIRATYAGALELVRTRNYRLAIRRLGEVVDAAPDRIEGWRLMGVAYAGQERWKDARRAYERALRLQPDDVLSHAGRGAALLALNDPAASEEFDWLKARSAACAGTCPDAGVLKSLETSGPFALPPS